MVTQTVVFKAASGRTVTAKIFAVGSDTVVESVTATEETNQLETYKADFTDAAAGLYKIIAFDSVITPPLATWWVDLTLDTATFYAYEMPVSVIQNGLATPINITAATGIVLAGVTHTGAIIPRVTLVDTTTTNTDMVSGFATQTSLDAKLTAARLGVLTSLESMIVANVYTTASLQNAPSGTGGDATAANQDLLLARLATGPIRITSTVTAGGVVNLRVGDDYVGTRIAITFDDAGGTIMTYMQSASVASVIFGAGRNTEINEIYGTVDPDDGVYDSGAGTSTVYPQIARADITGPVSDDYGYQIKAIDTAGRHITKIAGSVVVLAKNAFPV